MDEALFFFSDNYFAPAIVQQPVCKHDSYRELQVALFWFCFRTICIYAVTRELLYVGVPLVASYVKAALLHAMGFKKDTFAEAVGEAVEAAEEAVESLISEEAAPPAAAPTPPIHVPAAPPASPVDAAKQTDLLE